MALKKIADNIWVAEQDFTFGVFGNIGVKMTVIRLPTQELILISPIRLTDELKTELRALGTVRYLVGPNSFHHLFLEDYQETYPSAKLYGPQTLITKRPDLRFYGTLTDAANSDPWNELLTSIYCKGRGVFEEILFFHGPSKTMIIGDLFFHFEKGQNWKQDIIFRIFGIRGGLRRSRVSRFMFSDLSNRQKLKDWIRKQGPQRLILSHGAVISQKNAQLPEILCQGL